ncbi:MAG: hypothetical protein LBD24_03675, partial [Spirochaetaceae bacterium]|nr:hypothetical protein [Spirochaetaceae bacterium]
MTKAPGLLLLTLLLLLAGRGGAETWYRSNAAGMALEPVESRLAALRLEFCLAVTEVSLEELPYYAQEYYESGYVPEL